MKAKKLFRLALLSLLLFSITQHACAKDSSGKKPQWVNNIQALNNKRTNHSYVFMQTYNTGKDLQQLIEGKLLSLVESIGQEYNIEHKEGDALIENNEGGAVNSSTANVRISYKIGTTTKVFSARFVDEYWEYIQQPNGIGSYQYHALYAVSANGQTPNFDEFSSSNSYGAAPALMSIIPGLGQFYKGSTVKGICMLGGVAAFGIGALFCENQRADYKNKMKEQPKFAQTYNTKANNYETARNICLGAAAAVWVYNIIDAATAKGAKHIIVKPSNGRTLSLHPVATPNSAALSLTCNF